MMRIIFVAIVLGVLSGHAHAADPPLALVEKIPLGEVKGSLGNVSMDAEHNRLLVAETHNNSFSVISLARGEVVKRVSGLNLPLDIEYIGKVGAYMSNTIYVSNGGDGMLHTFDGDAFTPGTAIKLGGEVEDIVADTEMGHVLAGYGDGGIAVIDATVPAKAGEIPLKAHPEEFVIDAQRNRIYANVPNRNVVAVIDRIAGQVIAEWKIPAAQFNAMAITPTALLLAAQAPAKLISVSVEDGRILNTVDMCAEAETVLMDAARRRAYVTCGNGNMDVFQFDPQSRAAPALIARLPTAPLAKTAFFDERTSRVYLAVPAGGQNAAAIWIYAARQP